VKSNKRAWATRKSIAGDFFVGDTKTSLYAKANTLRKGGGAQKSKGNNKK